MNPKTILVVCVLIFAGCDSVQDKIPVVSTRYRECNEGYALLYELTRQEQNVDKILMVKNANEKVSAEIKKIAQIFGQAHDQLDAFAKQYPRLRFETTRLPTLEKKTRDSIESQTTKTLLFSSGRNFELQLLLTQVQALQYAAHLAKELGGMDDSQNRKSFLNQFSKQCEQRHQHVIELLSSL
ncbi:MAG: hypothetical protein LUQ68_06665 [Methylococcaceae bacterium]|nr:hypothetical protein [Methylococcaceae bacterium]